MEPEIRFCTGPDGVRTAYTAVGRGPSLVLVPSWCINIELIWRKPDLRHPLETLCRDRLFVMLDRRGIGCSQRDVDDLSLEAQIRDINAVADNLQMERFSLFGAVDGSPVAVAYAARYPERVSRLILWAPYPRGSEVITREALDSLLGLIRNNWGVARRALADITFPTGPTEAQRWFADLLRQSMSRETATHCLEFQNTVDVAALLPQVKAPTLILHRRDCSGIPIDAGKACAASIPDVRFVTLEGDILHPFFGDTSYLETVIQFLQEDGGVRRTTNFRKLYDTARETQSEWLEGKTISHYKILEKLGEGGMGVVYKAEDMKLERTVALKFLTPQSLGTEDEKLRFVREAKAAAALDHPNICTVYEIDESEGQTFIAMAYLDGQSLEERVEQSPMNPDEVLDIAIQVAEGLQEAHDRGIIHRDIKSANIIISRRGQPRIMDFGLAKLAGRTRLTKTATIMGTVAYMSPEQAHGDVTIDQRTDIWSLGVVLYEMLTGRLPFDAPSDAGLIHKIIYEEPEPIANLQSDVPAALEQAVRKAIQKDPQSRYEDMGALSSDLKSIRAGASPSIIVEEKSTPSIAVLPFADMSPQKDQEYFCDGISEALINALTQLHGLRVIARTSAFSFKGQSLDVREIGKKLNVGSVLEGSIQKAGDRVRVTAQLVNAAHGEHLWSEKYDRDIQDIFAIQDEISEAIVYKLKPKLLGEAKPGLSKRQTVDLDAYHLYLKGRWFWNKQTEEGLKKAIECFENAIQKVPNYALAHAGLSDSYILLPFFGPFRPREIYPKARQAAIRVLEIDDTLAESHTSLGMVKTYYDWDWDAAENEFRRAIELKPDYPTAHHYYAIYLVSMGRSDEAISEAMRALELDPLSLHINTDVGLILDYAGRHEQAIEQYKKTFEMDPNWPNAHLQLGFSYLHQLEPEEAIAEFEREKALRRSWSPLAECGTGMAYALLDKGDRAQYALDDLIAYSKEVYVAPIYFAGLYFSLGEIDRGFEWLEKAFEERDTSLIYLKVLPGFASVGLSSDPRYIELLKKMNLDK